MKAGEFFYALAVEEKGGFGLLNSNTTINDNVFQTLKSARRAKVLENCKVKAVE